MKLKPLTEIYDKYVVDKLSSKFEKQFRYNSRARLFLEFLGVTPKKIKTVIDKRLVGAAIEKYALDQTHRTTLQTIASNNGTQWIVDSTCSNDINASTLDQYENGSRLGLAVAVRLITGLGSVVGLQPMQGPVSLGYVLRYRDPVETEKAGDDPRRLFLDVISVTLEAKSRKLQAKFTIEAMQDFKSFEAHGIDLADQIAQALADEIYEDVVTDVLKTVKALAGSGSTIYEPKADETFNIRVLTQIQSACNKIASDTRRGTGNIIIVPPSFAVSLIESGHLVKADVKSDVSFNSALSYVGIIHGTIKLYTSTILEDEVIIGYKGGNGAVDTGFIYAPYAVSASCGIVIDEFTYQPIQTLFTRYGMHAVDNVSSYYKVLKIVKK